jgi:hypothetical protein
MAQGQVSNLSFFLTGHISQYDGNTHRCKVVIPHFTSDGTAYMESGWIQMGTIWSGNGFGIQIAPWGGASIDEPGRGEQVVMLVESREGTLYINGFWTFNQIDNAPGQGYSVYDDSGTLTQGFIQKGEAIIRHACGNNMAFKNDGSIQISANPSPALTTTEQDGQGQQIIGPYTEPNPNAIDRTVHIEAIAEPEYKQQSGQSDNLGADVDIASTANAVDPSDNMPKGKVLTSDLDLAALATTGQTSNTAEASFSSTATYDTRYAAPDGDVDNTSTVTIESTAENGKTSNTSSVNVNSTAQANLPTQQPEESDINVTNSSVNPASEDFLTPAVSNITIENQSNGDPATSTTSCDTDSTVIIQFDSEPTAPSTASTGISTQSLGVGKPSNHVPLASASESIDTAATGIYTDIVNTGNAWNANSLCEHGKGSVSAAQQIDTASTGLDVPQITSSLELSTTAEDLEPSADGVTTVTAAAKMDTISTGLEGDQISATTTFNTQTIGNGGQATSEILTTGSKGGAITNITTADLVSATIDISAQSLGSPEATVNATGSVAALVTISSDGQILISAGVLVNVVAPQVNVTSPLVNLANGEGTLYPVLTSGGASSNVFATGGGACTCTPGGGGGGDSG